MAYIDYMDLAVLRSHYIHSRSLKQQFTENFSLQCLDMFFLLYEMMQVFPIYLLISLPLTEMYMAMKLPLHVHYVQALSIDLSLQPLAGGWPLTQQSHPFSWVEHVVYWPYWI